MGFLTRLLAGLTAAVALGAGLTGTANAVDVTGATGNTKSVVKLADDGTSNLPDHLVNSDFEYLPDGGWKTISARYDMASAYTSVDPNNGQYIRNTRHADSDTGTAWVDWDGFDSSRFAWRTDQKGGQMQGGLKDHANAVELQQDSVDGNTYTEIVASETDRTIYQDLATIPGTLYKIRLKHASLCKDNVDQMQVVINGTPIEMTRVTANGKAGDKVGEKSTTIATKVTNENRWHHADQWETYEGYYVIPDGQTTTRFGFKAVNYLDPTKGNLLDDVTFARAYKLSYDKNSTDATGEVPSNQRGKENTTQPAKTKTSGTVKTVADTNASLPDHLVNGDFEYPGANVLNNKGDWWGVSRKDRMVFAPQPRWVSLPSTFDSDRFAWDSTEVARVQNESSQWHTNEVELQRDSRTGNMYAELCAYQAHTSIHQYIHTTPGTLYKVRLKHASLSRDYLDKMQVLIGPDGNEQPVRMTRVESQNGLDATGKATASTTVSTHASNEMEIKDGQGGAYSSRNHDGQWATYEGVYVATSDVTSFTFKSVDSKQYNLGNLLDDIVFDKAYRLSYDKNAQDATGSIPSDTAANTTQPAKSETDGKVSDLVQRTTTHEDGSVTVKTIDTSTDVVSGCQVYYPAGQRITLATMAKDDDCWDSSMLSRPGHTQLGWNQDRNATQAQAEVTMVEGGMTVFAVWVGNPVLTYDTNKPNTWNGQMPSTPASVSVAYNTAAADGSGWQSGDTSKLRGYRFLGWYTGPQDNAGLYDWNTLLTSNVTVYAHWQRLQANVIYDKNASDAKGSHANTTGWQYSDVTIPGDTSKSFTRDGYVFKGWSLKAGKADVVYKDGSQIPLQDKDITLYAQWQGIHENFTETGGISLPLLIAGGIGLLVMGVGSTVMLTRRMNGHGMPDGE